MPNFDRLAYIIDKEFPQYKSVMIDARIFTIIDKEKPPKQLQDDWPSYAIAIDNLKLPFKTIAIEHTKECVTLQQTNKDNTYNYIIYCKPENPGNPELIGHGTVAITDKEYHYDIHTTNCDIQEAHFYQYQNKKLEPLSPLKQATKKLNLEEHTKKVIQIGSLRPPITQAIKNISTPRTQSWDNEHTELTQVLTQAKEYVGKIRSDILLLTLEACLLHVAQINNPTTFIVEESLITHTENKNRILKTHERPKYILLEIGEIRKRIIPYEETDLIATDGTKVTPHERRGHYRRLTSERYIHKKGQLIWIKSMWVGRTEAIIGKNRYRVILDQHGI